MGENTVFILLTALIRNFYKFIMARLTWRGSDSKQQAASRRLSSSSSLCQPNGAGHQGSMCWISIHATTLMLMCSRMTLDDTDNLWSWFCVLPQVAWWDKGNIYVFMVTFDALCPPLLTMQIIFASAHSFRNPFTMFFPLSLSKTIKKELHCCNSLSFKWCHQEQ